MPTIEETLKRATIILQSSGIAEPRREASSLLAVALGKDRTFLITQNQTEIDSKDEDVFNSFLARRAKREPFQYIIGKQEFYGLDFMVTPAVLIPRPETEMIVENALTIIDNSKNPRFCEVGVGSGCISVAILANSLDASGIGLEISPAAIEIARQNAEFHGVALRFDLQISDVFRAAGDEKFDLVVTNPPYIPAADIGSLQDEVRDFEPLDALTDGLDGLSIVRQIVDEAPRFLKHNGFLLMEIGFGQADAVEAMFDGEFWRDVAIRADLQGIRRMVKARCINV